jgi:hypothetical protein
MLVYVAGILGAVLAPLAFAEDDPTGHFFFEVHHTRLHGEQIEKFNNKLHMPTINTIECEMATYDGTVTNTTVESATLTPTYSGCRNESRTVDLDMNGCLYTATIRKTQSELKHNTVHLICPAGQSVTLTLKTGSTLACTIHMNPQTPKGGVTYTTAGSAGSTHDILAHLTLSAIHATRTPAFFGGCLFASETNAEASLTGTVTFRGYDTEGNQKAITATDGF